MSGEREGEAFSEPTNQPVAKPGGESHTQPNRDFSGEPESHSGAEPERSGATPARKARRADEADSAAPSEENPHAGKFYERFTNRPKGKRDERGAERDDRRPDRPERSLQSSEFPQRIPSSANARNFDDRRERPYERDPRSSYPQDRPPARYGNNFDPRREQERRPAFGPGGRRDDFQQRGPRQWDDQRGRPDDRSPRGYGPQEYRQRPPERSFEPRRDDQRRPFEGRDDRGRRDDYQQRGPRQFDDRRDPRDRPFDREPRQFGPAAYDDRRPPGSFAPRPDAERRPRGDYGAGGRRDDYPQRDSRQFEDRRDYRAPRDDYRRPQDDYRRGPSRPPPHLEHRLIRSEGAKADQRPLPPPRPEAEAPLSAAREVAARVLLRHAQGKAFVEDLLEEAFSTSKMRPDDRRLTQEMVYGCVRWQAALDWLIAQKTEGRPQMPQVQVFLRLGLYQLFFLDRIPPHAACFETVEIAKRLGFVQQSNFINAIFRRLDAERASVKDALAELQASQPHLGFSHPEWLVAKWTARWGADDTRRMLEWNNTTPRTNTRVNTLKTDSAKLVERWRLHENVEYDFLPCTWTEEHTVFTLKVHPSLATLGSFQEGWFYVQDPSTLLAVQALDPWAGESILDLCAAPGGKTAYIAQKMENDGELLACDSSPDRLKLVTENCTRLGVTCVKTLALGDHPEAVLQFQKFDKVLVDAPCSNTGVLRRRIDLRWRLQPDEPARLRETQLKLLHLASMHLKPGGLLVYSTCSVEPEENSEVVKDFLAAHPQFTLESERDLLPFRDGVDGAYVAKLRG